MSLTDQTASTMSPQGMREHVGEACSFLKTLANEDRLMLLCQLAASRQNVGELEATTGIHQPTLSQQLAVLRQESLVETTKEGKYVYYQLADPKVLSLIRTLSDIYCDPR